MRNHLQFSSFNIMIKLHLFLHTQHPHLKYFGASTTNSRILTLKITNIIHTQTLVYILTPKFSSSKANDLVYTQDENEIRRRERKSFPTTARARIESLLSLSRSTRGKLKPPWRRRLAASHRQRARNASFSLSLLLAPLNYFRSLRESHRGCRRRTACLPIYWLKKPRERERERGRDLRFFFPSLSRLLLFFLHGRWLGKNTCRRCCVL